MEIYFIYKLSVPISTGLYLNVQYRGQYIPN